MNTHKLRIPFFIAVTAAMLAILSTGCMTSKVVTTTPASTNAITGAVTAASTVTNTIVNQANLAIDCAAIQLIDTPVLIYALQNDPAARPIAVDVAIALEGAINGADSNVVATITQLVGGNPALAASVQPLIVGASGLEQNLLAKYGNVNGVIIGKAIAQAALNSLTLALAAVPATTLSTPLAPTPAKNPATTQ